MGGGGCDYSLTSQGGHLQPELNGGDMLFQQTSTLPGERRPNSTGKSRLVTGIESLR